MKQYLSLLCVLVFIAGSAAQNQSAEVYFKLAEDYRGKSQTDSALFYYEKAASIYNAKKNIEKEVNAYNQMGIMLTWQDQYEKGRLFLEKALSSGKSLDENNLAIATTYISLGVIAAAEGNFSESLSFHNKALKMRLARLGENSADVATSYGNIGNVYLRSKEYNKAVDAHLKAKTIRQKLFGESGAEVTQSYIHLGHTYREKKEYSSALVYFEKALKNKAQQSGPGHKDVGKIYSLLSDVYYLMGNKAQGDAYKAKAM